MNIEGAMELTARFGPKDPGKVAEAAVLLRAEVVHLQRLLRLAGHSFKHDSRPSQEVRFWWDENL